jgi:hypothetical protein
MAMARLAWRNKIARMHPQKRPNMVEMKEQAN